MALSQYTSALISRAVLALIVAVLSVAFLLGGAGFLVAAAYLVIAAHEGVICAAIIMGGVLVLLAGAVALIGNRALAARKRAQPSLLGEFAGIVTGGVSLVTALIRNDPKKALLLSVLAGLLAEYVTTPKKD